MTIDEVLKGIALADTALLSLIGARMFPVEAPQGCTLPYAVYMLDERIVSIHNTSVTNSREWGFYLYSYGASPVLAKQLAIEFKRVYCLYKESEPGASDADIQSITIMEGIQDLSRTALSKGFPCSLILNVWEQIGA